MNLKRNHKSDFASTIKRERKLQIRSDKGFDVGKGKMQCSKMSKLKILPEVLTGGTIVEGIKNVMEDPLTSCGGEHQGEHQECTNTKIL